MMEKKTRITGDGKLLTYCEEFGCDVNVWVWCKRCSEWNKCFANKTFEEIYNTAIDELEEEEL